MNPIDESGDEEEDVHEYASPACFMHEVDPAYMGLPQPAPAMSIADFERGLFANAPDGVLYADQNGIIRFWNAGCHRIFGFTEQEAVGQSLDIIIPDALRARHWQGYAQTMRSGQTRYGAGDLLAVPALRKDGARISVEFSIVPFRDPAGTMMGMGAIMRDVTKRFEELKNLRKALAASNAPQKE
jgi:PAS domain S-box-containing protein